MTIELKPDEMSPEDWEEFQKIMDKSNEAMNDEIHKIAKDLKVSDACATDVWYLRTRSRHTPELEQELIRLHALGTPPNVCEFGHKVSSSAIHDDQGTYN